MTRNFTMPESNYADRAGNGGGICLVCGEEADGVEPDARNYRCGACGKRAVFGLEEALVLGRIDFTDEGE